MAEVIALCSALQGHFNWNLARIKCLSQTVLALLRVKTVNLAEIASAFKGNTTQDSNYRRIQRFLSGFEFCMNAIARFTVSIFPLGDQWTLALDRTNWLFGKSDINVFMLFICYHGVAIPLFWMLLGKRGNSNTKERIQLVQRVTDLFGAEKIRRLLGDREFIGKGWFRYLLDAKIPFVFRIRSNMITTNSRGQKVPVKNLFRNLRIGECRVLGGKRMITGAPVYLVGERTDGGELRIIIADCRPELALEQYSWREEIEHLFGCLKTRGFRFEDTHLTKPDRIEKLIAVMTIAFCWSHRSGDLCNEVKPIKRKNHGRRTKTIFKVGYEYLRNLLVNVNDRFSEYIEVVAIISNGSKRHNTLKSMMGA